MPKTKLWVALDLSRSLFFWFTKLFSGPQSCRHPASSTLTFPPQDPEHGLPDGLGLDTVDDGVEHRGHQQVHISNKGTYNGGQVPPQMVDHGHGDTWNKEDDDGQDMGDTGVEGPMRSLGEASPRTVGRMRV